MKRLGVVALCSMGCTSVLVIPAEDDGAGGAGAAEPGTTTSTASSGGRDPDGGGGEGGSGGDGGSGGEPSLPCEPGTTSACYDGPPGSSGVGSCVSGTRACLADGSGFGPCEGQVVPADVDDCETPADEDCDGFAIASCEGFLPLPPNAQSFGWQTLQERFVKDGVPCTGEVTIAAGTNAVCYAGSDDRLYCAGTSYEIDYGPTYVDAGLGGPLQILIAPDFHAEGGDGMCVVLRNGTMMCRGVNADGQFGLGSSDAVPGFMAWGGRGDIARAATGNSDQLCVLTISGEVYCAGAGFGDTPVLQGNASSVWIDTSGVPHLDDADVYRASAGATYCRLRSDGLDCDVFTVDLLVDDIVDGGDGWIGPSACYLQASGNVACIKLVVNGKETTPRFQEAPVLALAVTPYASSMCAVHTDGSLWCMGFNGFGQLGTGDYLPSPQVETQVAPPGTVRVACD